MSYAIIEATTAIISILSYGFCGFNDAYIIIVIFSASCLLSIFLYLDNDEIFDNINCFIAVLGAFYSTLLDYSIIPWLFRFFTFVVIGISFLRIGSNFVDNSKLILVKVMIISSLWLNGMALICYIMLLFASYFLLGSRKLYVLYISTLLITSLLSYYTEYYYMRELTMIQMISK